MHRSMMFASALAALVACGGEEEKDAGSTEDTVDTDPQVTDSPTTDTLPDDTDVPTDTDDTDVAGSYLEVAALGFRFNGSWDQDQQLLEPFLIPDVFGAYGAPKFIPHQVFITLATADYFSYGGDAPDSEYCYVVAAFDGAPVDLTAQEFDYAAGAGSTGRALETWGMFEGKLTIETMSAECSQLDPAVWPGGDPMALLDGMHFGLGYGPLSTYMEGELGAALSSDWATLEEAYVAQYIAINHPDGAGGYEFIPYDWNGAFLVETDYSVCESHSYSGDPVEVCGMLGIELNDMGAPEYVLGDKFVQPIHAYTQGFSMWWEDVPNLDLTLLGDGA